MHPNELIPIAFVCKTPVQGYVDTEVKVTVDVEVVVKIKRVQIRGPDGAPKPHFDWDQDVKFLLARSEYREIESKALEQFWELMKERLNQKSLAQVICETEPITEWQGDRIPLVVETKKGE